MIIKKIVHVWMLLFLVNGAFAADVFQFGRTNAATLVMKFTVKPHEVRQQDGILRLFPPGNYEVTLPFSEYQQKHGALYPNNRYMLGQGATFDFPGGEVSLQPRVPTFAESRLFEASPEPKLVLDETVIVQSYKPVTVIKDGSHFATIYSVKLEEKGVLTGDNLQALFNATFGELHLHLMGVQVYGPGHVSVHVSNLDAPAMLELGYAMLDMSEATTDAARRAQQQRVLAQLKYICKPDAQLSASIQVQTRIGPLSGNYVIDLPELVSQSLHISSLLPLSLNLALLS